MKQLMLILSLLIAAAASLHAYYDTETGEFLTRDPAGFVDGPNVYSYVKENPWTHFDPEGLSPQLGPTMMSDPESPATSTDITSAPNGYRYVSQGGSDFRNSAEVDWANFRLNGDQASLTKFTHDSPPGPVPGNASLTPTLAYDDPDALNSYYGALSAAPVALSVSGSRSPGEESSSPGVGTAEAVNASNKGQSTSIEPSASRTSAQTEEAVTQVTVDASKHPESAQHIQEAQESGQPTTLTIDRGGASTNRKAAMQGNPKVSGKDRDEYPPAMFQEGGQGASVKPISPGDNRGAGSTIMHQTKDLPDGSKVQVTVKNADGQNQ